MWLRMLRVDQSLDRIVTYSWRDRLVRPLGEFELPWPAVVALGGFHRKHIILDPRRPDLKQVAKDLTAFGNRIKWAWFHRAEQQPYTRLIKRLPPPCREVVPPELSAWVYSFRKDMLGLANKQIKLHRYRSDRPSNCPQAVLEGAKWLASSGWSVLESDKDHKLVLMRRSELKPMLSSYMCASPYYQLVDEGLVRAHFTSACAQLRRVAKQIEDRYGPTRLAATLMLVIPEGIPFFIRRLAFTVKTRKGDGDVSLRAIHAGPPRNLFSPLGAWFQDCCKRRLSELGVNHVLLNSRQVLEALSGAAFPCQLTAIRLDVKDYFLTGTADELRRIVMDTAIEEEKLLIGSIVELLLTNQFVEAVQLGLVYKVRCGAGMGLNYAGELADLVLAWQAERSLNNPGLKYFGRFKDDILVLWERRPELYKPWLAAYIRKARPYTVKVERISSESVTMLDLRLTISNLSHGSNIVVTPFVKPTAAKIPLAVDSGHPASVHLSWPVNELRRIRSQCASDAMFAPFKRRFISSFVNNASPPPFLDFIQTHQCRRLVEERGRCIWFVTKFQPILVGALKRALARANARNVLLDAAFEGLAPKAKIAFRSHDAGIAKHLVRLTT